VIPVSKKKVAIDKLEEAIEGILDDYGDAIQSNVDLATEEIGAVGLKAIKAKSREVFKRKPSRYANSWTLDKQHSRLGTTVVLHNKMAGLPHLLENGHVNRDGSRTEGRPHISVVEQTIVKKFKQKVEEVIKRVNIH
jgi:hypothetical protein